jgi:hypothetical protein
MTYTVDEGHDDSSGAGPQCATRKSTASLVRVLTSSNFMFSPFHEKACNVNRSFLVLGFDCVPSFHSGVSRRARVQSQVERSEPEGNLDGFLARLHDSRQNEGKTSARALSDVTGRKYERHQREGERKVLGELFYKRKS